MSGLRFTASLSFAGFCLAHAIWSVDGADEVLTTLLAQIDQDGTPSMTRIDAGTIPESIESARSRASNAAASLSDAWAWIPASAHSDASRGRRRAAWR